MKTLGGRVWVAIREKDKTLVLDDCSNIMWARTKGILVANVKRVYATSKDKSRIEIGRAYITYSFVNKKKKT